MKTNERYDWADFARGLLMVLVFIYHSEVYYYDKHSWSWVFSPFFLTGFFFVSGFLFTRDIQSVSLLGKWKQVFRGLIFPYIVFETLMIVPKVITGRADYYQLLIDFFLFRGSWFIVAIGVMQLLYAVVLGKKASFSKLALWSFVFFIFGIILCSIYKNAFPYCELVKNNRILYSAELPNRLPFCLNFALLNCPYFALGIVCRQFKDRFLSYCGRKSLITSSFLYLLLYCIVDHSFIGSWWVGSMGTYNNLLLMIIYAIIGIWMICCYSTHIKLIRPINYIGKYSIVFLFLNGGGLVFMSLITTVPLKWTNRSLK